MPFWFGNVQAGLMRGYAARLLREEHEEVLEWLGWDFDPEAFDLGGVNAAVRRIR